MIFLWFLFLVAALGNHLKKFHYRDLYGLQLFDGGHGESDGRVEMAARHAPAGERKSSLLTCCSNSSTYKAMYGKASFWPKINS